MSYHESGIPLFSKLCTFEPFLPYLIFFVLLPKDRSFNVKKQKHE